MVYHAVMTKARYSNEVLIKNGRIRRSVPIGIDAASEEQITAIGNTKSVMHAWLRSKILNNPALHNAEILVRAKYVETSSGLTIEFKVQSVIPIG